MAVMAVTAVYAPWGFYSGGKFHIIPYWQGWGTLHAHSGDFHLSVSFEPSPRGSRMFSSSNLRGTGHLCAPRGERFRMNLGDSMRAPLNLSTDARRSAYMNNWPVLTGSFTANHRPSLQLRGRRQNPNLVMDDEGSFRLILPDCSVY